METIYINYKNTGIKTLRGVAYFTIGAGSLASILAFMACFVATGGRYTDEFVWTGLISVLAILSSTLFISGICFALAYLSESAFVARKQREALLVEKGIELEFLEREETIRIKHKKTGWISDVTLSRFEEMKAQSDEDEYEIVEDEQ
jgi:small-conductance mechanosensitive channel